MTIRNRQIFTSLFAGAIAASPVPQTTPSDQPVYELSTGAEAPVSYPRQYTIALDTNHGDIEVLREFSKVLRNFIRDGGTDLVMERDNVYERIFNAVKSGQYKLSDFSDVMDASAYIPEAQVKEAQALFQGIMQTALDGNIRFHAWDHEPEANKKYPDVVEAIVASRTGQPEFLRERMQDPSFRERRRLYDQEFKIEREAINAEVIANTRALGADAKVLLYYGNTHGLPIARGLGRDKTQGIMITNPGTVVGSDVDAGAKPKAQKRHPGVTP